VSPMNPCPRFFTACSLLAAMLATAAPEAVAEGLSVNLSIVNNYKSRGQDQSANKPALQGGIEYQWQNGFTLGNWNSSVGWSPEVSVESDVYGSYAGVLKGVTYQVGFIRYGFPGYNPANTLELSAGVGFSGLALRYSESVSRRYFTYDTRATYWSLHYTHSVSDALSLVASIGRTNYLNNAAVANLPDYTDFRLSVERNLGGGFSLTAGSAGATRTSSHGVVNKPRLLVGLSKLI